jgi:spore germination protein GerM
MNIEIKDVNDIENNEIVPQEEISDAQLRETLVCVYYVDNNNEIVEENQKIDSKNLIKDPYTEVMKLLLNGTKHDNLKTCIPDNVRVNGTKRDGECLFVDLSKEFVDNMSENQEIQSLAISQIVNTMTQFSEINCVKILIDGEANQSFKNGNIRFEQLFFNED